MEPLSAPPSAAAPLQLILAPCLPSLKRVFTPLFSGIVVMLIGLSIIPEAMRGIVAPAAPGAPAVAGGGMTALVLNLVLPNRE